MNIRDLRPGNLIRWVQTNEIVTVTGVFEDKREVTARKADGTNVEDIIDAFEGVGLTLWVLQDTFGFTSEESELTYECLTKGNFLIENEPEEEDRFYFDRIIQQENNASFKVFIDYVHELQNVYYWANNKNELAFISNAHGWPIIK